MRIKNTKLIVNPNADLGRAWRSAADLRPVIEELGGADWIGTVYPTHAIELARQAAEDGYENVIAVGGDGTVHEVINGLLQARVEKLPRLGVVPLGTGNDFAQSLGLPNDPTRALRQTMNGHPKRIDIGKLQDERGRKEYWNNTLGIGFDTTVTLRSRRIPVLSGFPVYFIAVVQTILLDHIPMQVKIMVDNEPEEEEILMLVLCNGSNEGGGFRMAPDAKPDDERLEYVYVGKISRPRMFRLLPEVIKGTHLRFPEVKHGHFKSMEIRADRPMYIHTDGEIFTGFGSDIRQIAVEILPGALEVLV
jgi:YegS/Rv2252/BmrU family lipid kinase